LESVSSEGKSPKVANVSLLGTLYIFVIFNSLFVTLILVIVSTTTLSL